MDKPLWRGSLQDCRFSWLITELFHCFFWLFRHFYLPLSCSHPPPSPPISFSLFLWLLFLHCLPSVLSIPCLPTFIASLLSLGSVQCSLFSRGPASLPGRVMYEWLALTSLHAQRHSNSVLPGFALSGAFSQCLSLISSPPYPPLITSLFFCFSFTCLFLSGILSVLLFPLLHFFILSFIFHCSGLCTLCFVSLLCPPSSLFSPFWSFLFSSKAASSPPFFPLFYSSCRHTNIQKHDMFEPSRQAASQPLFLMWNIDSSLFNYTYQDQLYSWITWFHKTHSLFPTVPSQFSLWQLCFARCPVTHLYLWGKLPVALTKINLRGAV